MERVRQFAARLGELARAILGAPNYERYVAHMRACHPGELPLSAAEFGKERMEARYSKVGSRCC